MVFLQLPHCWRVNTPIKKGLCLDLRKWVDSIFSLALEAVRTINKQVYPDTERLFVRSRMRNHETAQVDN